MRLLTFLPALVVLSLLVFPQLACHKKQVPVGLPPTPAAKAQPETTSPAGTQPGSKQPAPTASPVSSVPTAPSSTTPSQTPGNAPKDETLYQKNKPPDQPPPPKRAARPATPTAPLVQGPTQSNAAPPETPHLGDVLTPDQQRQYNAAIDQSLAHAQASLTSLANHQLSQEQQATMVQVQSFLEQAQEKRKTDLAAAKSLAERAEVLASDLVASIH